MSLVGVGRVVLVWRDGLRQEVARGTEGVRRM